MSVFLISYQKIYKVSCFTHIKLLIKLMYSLILHWKVNLSDHIKVVRSELKNHNYKPYILIMPLSLQSDIGWWEFVVRRKIIAHINTYFFLNNFTYKRVSLDFITKAHPLHKQVDILFRFNHQEHRLCLAHSLR